MPFFHRQRPRTAYGAVLDAAAEMAERGSFTFAEAATPFKRLDGIFAAWHRLEARETTGATVLVP